MQPSHGPVAFHPGTRQDDQIQEPATLIYNGCKRPGSQSTTTNHTEKEPLSHYSGSWTLDIIMNCGHHTQPNNAAALIRIHIDSDLKKVYILEPQAPHSQDAEGENEPHTHKQNIHNSSPSSGSCETVN